MRQRIFLLILLFFFIAIVFFVSSNTEHREAISVKELKALIEKEQQQKYFVLGNIYEISPDSFTIVDLEFPEHEIKFELDPEKPPLQNFAIGETVLITVISNEKEILEIQKTDRDDALKHLQKDRPLLEINIVEYPKEIENPCEEITFKLNIKNVGNSVVNYHNLYDEMYGYYLFYNINDEIFNFYNIEDFGSLDPTQEKEILLTSQEGLNSNMSSGENSITFSWAKKSIYDNKPTVLSQSKTIDILLKNDSCN